MPRTNETAQQAGKEMFSNLLSIIATVVLITITAMQVPDVLIWLAK
ncbi:hypothetical protein [Pseudomonas arsenicoxydans]|nr:hypothetical protein [Pseudomonas arsenicoxydans]